MAERYNEAYVLVSNEEYEQLKKDSDWLQCLESAGVDNWEGYDHARAIERGEEE